MTDLPSYSDFFNPLLDALRALGGSARPEEAYELIAEREGLTEDQLALENQGGASRFKNRVAWARFYLARAGYIDDSRRGVWSLTEAGRECGTLSPGEASKIQREVQESRRSGAKGGVLDEVGDPDQAGIDEGESEEVDTSSPEPEARLGHRDKLKSMFSLLSPDRFERFCQRLLREAGFERVRVLGRSGDGGIDGEGLLKVNPLLSLKVIFQCKRYSSPVSSPNIRDFRGAIAGRADRGLFITTSTFTRDAQREAVRDGADPIELLDAEGIIDLLEELQLGVTRVDTFTVDGGFFEQFR